MGVRKCVNCGHNIRSGPPASIECHCDIDGHYIGYIANFEHWCRRWKKDHTFDAVEHTEPLALDEETMNCVCGETPVRETRTEMMGKLRDGGYETTIGRFHCPVCGGGPSWGQSYSVTHEGGWEKNAAVWNKWVRQQMTGK